MYTDDDLNDAVSAGVLSHDTATAFRDHVAARRQTPVADEEQFRLITGFNDIFVVIACVLLLVSVSWIGGTVTPVLGSLASAATAWGLAEFFVRKRRMALPAIVLLLAFAGSVFSAGLGLAAPALGGSSVEGMMRHAPSAAVALASLLAGVATWLHWRRFQVPITIACVSAAAVACLIALITSVLPAVDGVMTPLLLVAGIAVFAFAMRWDTSDPTRQTRRSDVAFWLHLLAAPLMVHPVFMLLGVTDGDVGMPQAVAVVVLYVGIALVSLCIDRRALMVSALGYVLYAFSSLLKQYGVVSLGFATTALFIGSALLMLSAFWQPSRAALIARLPASLQGRLAPVR
ncbi:hypothetical protein [Jeongeupia naejangsanensis]|uniref:DUF2157 domain-containing protein n=1 Tax=Jeongeupia naejangsanensis TaxID=613195 RepID=A0ABS2BN91_9NEIS|nr:hypothetical protein [Jeongeupia naejangsanensis]MBM3117090.1 hypothetical protein [Jeongeupia naejangsanensis]